MLPLTISDSIKFNHFYLGIHKFKQNFIEKSYFYGKEFHYLTIYITRIIEPLSVNENRQRRMVSKIQWIQKLQPW